MGKIISMPKKVEPYAFWAVPGRSRGLSKYVLTATPWNSDVGSKARGYVNLADLLEELAELGADRSILGSVKRTLEAGRACTIPRMWLTPPQIEIFHQASSAQAGWRSSQRTALVEFLPLDSGKSSPHWSMR